MSLVGFLILLIIAAVCGLIGQAISGRGGGGFLFAVVIGFVGALIGTWLASALNLPEFLPLRIEGHSFPVVWSIVGATLLSFVFGAISRRRGYHSVS
ncbi:MAG: GlsB/YeaQ/YmgE family stress response membrane protein [Blastocatellia bacterium]